ncbi:DNA-directed RNA polymerases I and III subunit RPAC2, putative [Plasmodium berghei]|uniref:DNA-directed RNA polymerases I and III subunit RPAC2, putative n=2 Tax=Plasmodium berghei TaxID=5821 RepID=A0A509ANI7_PLABA|nr:DNA-directed RNA polymerases I and III subunit RPAC2, putative [Plasmodium berghei ANKA]CXI54508.1 DNA-directed RNA polymerases I and III subunit RPAC2, putative [Plasmodium berghei]SCL94991.1 DNA-directed RNA polymerases I and III subunit RPAC2, putative [Plasmodium berghei]SCM16150.1 DNA-directed RNA polymerases I and III subunit RPAC2, putative [Plasmodium berghei]SCM17946.1 DNA-directed RNA polymerases I and III subunit RPAC2, putative [Plasmodium berghei]SCN26316.1 DNA-directed RNA pol|eukprot:XP_034422074.1 DNA-directed RNA polymerases I and III subunit RPAC2, putative [Plasmodium berghei ANKA]
MEEKSYFQNLKTITHATFCFENEDHTLGNCLRCILLQKEGIEFAGYTVPHPTQAEINLRIQTTGKPAINILKDSLDDLSNICTILLEKFKNALESA